MVEAAEIGIKLHIVQRVVHKAHVPLEAEAKSPVLGRGRDQREGRRLLRDRDRTGIVDKDRAVELLQEGNRIKVYITSFTVGCIFTVTAAVVKIQHRADRIHTNPVDVIFLKELAGRGDQEALYLAGGIIKDQRAPLRVLCHAALLAFKQGGAVKIGKAVLVTREVCRHPVHDHADVVAVQAVNEIGEVLRSAIAGGRRKVARDLIAPGGIIRILHQGHQLDMGIAHLLAVFRQHVRQIAILGALVAEGLPGAGMQLVDAHRAVHKIALFPLFHVGPVCPVIVVIIDHGGGIAAVLSPGGEGVALPGKVSVCLCHSIFVEPAETDVFHKSDPNAAFNPLHGSCGGIPAVEVTDDAYAACVRRPHDEAVHVDLGYVMAAEAEPCFLCVAGIEQINIILGDILHKLVVHDSSPLW